MNKIKPILSSKLFIFSLYFLAGIPLLIIFKHYFYSNDTFQYLSLARKYAEGNLSDAINGFIGPLLPWLLIPFIKLNIDPILSCKIIELIIGAFTLYNLHILTSKIIKNDILKIALNIAFVPVILSFSILYVSADLLFLSLFVIYLNLLLNDFPSGNYSNKTSIRIGIVAGLLYFTKSFGFSLFIVHFFVVYCWKYIKGRKADNPISWKPFLKAMFVFFSVCSLWIVPLSIKNHALTITTSGNYLFKALGPDYFPDDTLLIHHPAHINGLFPPVNSTAVSVWEDPNTIPMKSWSPFSSTNNFKHYYNVIWRNISSIYYHDFQRQTGVILLILFLLFTFFVKEPFKKIPSIFYLFLFTYLLYAGSISLIYFLPRYAWLNTFLLIFMIALLAEAFVTQKIFTHGVGYIFLGIALVLLVKRPVKELFFFEDIELHTSSVWETVKHPYLSMKNKLKRFDDYYAVMETLQQMPEFKGKIASHRNKDFYQYCSLICYYLRLPYYGELPDKVIAETGDKQLKQYDIDYYLDEKSSPENDDLLHDRKPVFTDAETGLRVYKLK